MSYSSPVLLRALVVLPAVIVFTAWLAAQQAQPQKSPFKPISQMGSGATQVNTALYGGGTSGSMRYSTNTSVAMNSEVRYAYAKSGALPSDVRMGYADLGPLTPGGAIDYIPPSPSYLGKSTAPVASVSPVGGGAYSGGSVRYAPSGGTMSAPLVSPRMVSGGPISSGPINSGPLNTGAIRFAR